jgi:hypothetical protein
MLTALIIAGSILGYTIIAGAVHGLLKQFYGDHDPDTIIGSIFWPFTPFVLGLFKVGNLISNFTARLLKQREEKELTKVQHRIQEIKKTRIDLRTAQEELREAEEELERELQEAHR